MSNTEVVPLLFFVFEFVLVFVVVVPPESEDSDAVDSVGVANGFAFVGS